MAEIRVENLRKEFSGFTAVQNSTFTVANGELGLTGTGAGFAQLMLDVKKNGASVARSRTTITQGTTGGATCDDSSGDLGSLGDYMNCGPTGNSASDGGGPYGVSMGLIGAGQSFTLDYDIIATVSGNLSQGTTTETQCYGGGGDGGYGGVEFVTRTVQTENGYGGGGGTCIDFEVPVPGSAIARSGDPFGSPIFFNGLPVNAPDPGAGLNGRFSDVPEPASLALVGVGLAGLAAMRRKRKLPEQG